MGIHSDTTVGSTLAQEGQIRAIRMGGGIEQSLKYPIHRVFVSPFLRCVQTAVELIGAFSTINGGVETFIGEDNLFATSKVKVVIFYY